MDYQVDYGSLDPTEPIYGTPAKYDTVMTLPLIEPVHVYSQSNIRHWNDRASLNVPPTPGGSYIWPSPLQSRRVQFLATPHQLRKTIVDYRPQQSPIGPGFQTWTGMPQQKYPQNLPGPSAYQEIQDLSLSNGL